MELAVQSPIRPIRPYLSHPSYAPQTQPRNARPLARRSLPVIVGRFAPSPTGPLHFGSLVAAAGSWLFARAVGGRWLLRIEDLDRPRVVPGSADELMAALERYGLEWDGTPMWQSQRTEAYAAVLARLRDTGQVYDCGCSRADLQRAPSAPAAGDPADDRIYPGTCRSGIPEGRAPRAVRFRVPHGVISFDDLVCGSVAEEVAKSTGDFVIRRADGLFAYQLAVVVDDAEQGVTQVVRGADLLTSTARQIALQQALSLPIPQYAHLPLIVTAAGAKLGKRDGALPLPSLDEARVRTTLLQAIRILGVDAEGDSPQEILRDAVGKFEVSRVPGESVALGSV
jgi:glutamyl-Q tRNA(Asp) synthetase